MKRGRIAWLAGGLAALVLAAFAAPYGYWGVVGLRNGEPFYRGLPCSFWRRSVLRHGEWMDRPPAWARHCPDRVLELLGIGEHAAVLRGDPDALPVVLALARDADRDLQRYGLLGLMDTEPGPRSVPFFRALLQDPDELIRFLAAAHLQKAGNEPGPVVSVYIALLGSPDRTRRGLAIWKLREYGPVARAASSALLQLAREDSTDKRHEAGRWVSEREDAGKALRGVDPETATAAGIR